MLKCDHWRNVAGALAAAGLLVACGGAPEGGADGASALPPATVDVLNVVPRDIALTQELPGRVAATRVAEVRARVAGIVLSRNFQEGSDVKAGQLLFRIDPAPYKVSLARAQGDLARADAAMADAQAVVRRYTPLAQVDAISQQEFDAAQTTLKTAQAARLSATADVESARLNLDYAQVKAPIAGRIGRTLVTEGALVGQGEATPMATIQQLHPIYVDFTQSAAEVLRLRESHIKGHDLRLTLAVEGTSKTREGRLVFTDAAVDRTTGQIALRGEFPNTDGLLLPGMYVRVQVAEGTQRDALLVPQRAVKRTADGHAHVMVLADGDKVQTRPVEAGALVGTEWHITKGLQRGDRVIVGGPAVNSGDSAVARATEPAASAASR